MMIILIQEAVMHIIESKNRIDKKAKILNYSNEGSTNLIQVLFKKTNPFLFLVKLFINDKGFAKLEIFTWSYDTPNFFHAKFYHVIWVIIKMFPLMSLQLVQELDTASK